MSARRIALLAAALVLTASELALWLGLRAVERGQAELRGRMLAHRSVLLPKAGWCSWHGMHVDDCAGDAPQCRRAREEMSGG